MEDNFLQVFKLETEKRWRDLKLNPGTFGWQIQKNTHWLPGHSDDEITRIFSLLNIPSSFKNKELVELLLFTKGLSLPQVNLNPQNNSDKYIQQWKLNLDYITNTWSKMYLNFKSEIEYKTLVSEFDLESEFYMLPIFGHRYIVITKEYCKVFSMWGDDVIIYGETIEEYLEKEFLNK